MLMGSVSALRVVFSDRRSRVGEGKGVSGGYGSEGSRRRSFVRRGTLMQGQGNEEVEGRDMIIPNSVLEIDPRKEDQACMRQERSKKGESSLSSVEAV